MQAKQLTGCPLHVIRDAGSAEGVPAGSAHSVLHAQGVGCEGMGLKAGECAGVEGGSPAKKRACMPHGAHTSSMLAPIIPWTEKVCVKPGTSAEWRRVAQSGAGPAQLPQQP